VLGQQVRPMLEVVVSVDLPVLECAW